MSGPPPHSHPAWYPPAYPTNYAYGRSYRSGNHPPPPSPTPEAATVMNVPPHFYGCKADTRYAFSQTQRYAGEEFTHRCDACQISLESEAALRAHTEAHVKCEQCSFTGSQKVVKGHFDKFHGKFAGRGFKTVTIAVPGCRVQRFRICVGNHPDDVQKWIQDRKRRFPRQSKKEEKDTNKKDEESKPAAALGSLLDGYGSSSSDSDDDYDDEKPQSAEMIAVSRAPEGSKISTTTMATVDTIMNDTMSSTMGRETSTVETKSAVLDVTLRPMNYKTRPCRYFMQNGSCRNGDACNFSHESTKHQSGKNSKMKGKVHSSSSTTLLQKLLESDARREATLSLQLLQYLVDCNYLQNQRNDERNAN